MEKRFKTKKAYKIYYDVNGLCFDFIYEWADACYFGDSTFDIVQKLSSKINPKMNIQKACDKLYNIFKDADYAFDLPEHPEKHNGYSSSYQYLERVMKVFGYVFIERKIKM